MIHLPGRIVAVPSWVLPGTVAYNAAFLSDRVDQVGLLFMEAASSREYGEDDLPLSLADLPLTWHAHLPVDLNWEDPAAAAALCCRLLDKAAHLRPWAGVLHAPPCAAALSAFCQEAQRLGYGPDRFLVENIRNNDLGAVAGSLCDLGMGVCLDLGHILAYGQEALLENAPLLERCRLVHFNAPGVGDRHAGLDTLDRHGDDVGRRLFARVPAHAVLMLELFRWSEVVSSLPRLQSWLVEGDHGLLS